MQPDIRNTKIKEEKSGCIEALKTFFFISFLLVFLVFGVPLIIEGIVRGTTFSDIKEQSVVVEEKDAFQPQAIVVLGAGINFDGSPSTILKDRLDTAISLYEEGVAPKIIMSGDNTESSYNEVMAMCNYAVKQGVNRDDVFCDHAGVSTYDTMYRLKYVFSVERCVLVSQEYHLYRCIYDAEGFGIKAVGVSADAHDYKDKESYEKREYAARIKDFFEVLFKVEPVKKSSPVSLDQSGRVTQWW